MEPWCTAEDVENRVSGTPDPTLCQEYAEQATSLLYVASGRAYAGVNSVTVNEFVNARGYISLTHWQPIHAVTSVTIDDVVVTFTVSRAKTRAIVDGWHAGKLAVMDLNIGQDPPQSGKKAAAALAAELLRGDPRYEATGATDIRPNFRLTNVTRQGVSYSYADPAELMENDMTGVYEVDLFLRAENPAGRRYQPKVVTT